MKKQKNGGRGSLDQTMFEQCAELSKEKYKKREMVPLLKPGGMCKAITCFSYKPKLRVRSCYASNQREKEKKKGKAQITKAKFPTKIQPYKVLLIHDYYSYYL